MSAIFISYRREDVPDVAFGIRDRIKNCFSRVFIDDRIVLGASYEEWLQRELQTCDILLAVIGPRWLDLARERSNQSNDWVRKEIEYCLGSNDCKVVSVMVDSGSLRSVNETDAVWLQRLRKSQYFSVKTGDSFPHDASELCCKLGEYGEEIAFTNAIGMKFVTISPGEFLMGSPKTERSRRDDECLHKVQISKPFQLGIVPVTQEQYRKVMGVNPSYFCETGLGAGKVTRIDTRSLPVENVSWDDAQIFCSRLVKQGGDGRRVTYRLPTEAEWEFSCRSCSDGPFSFGEDVTPKEVCYDSSQPYRNTKPQLKRSKPVRVGSFPNNAHGLYDMHGNICEWCHDRYAADYYRHSSKTDPEGPSEGGMRVLRGGGWRSPAMDCRSARRQYHYQNTKQNDIGFRLICEYN